MNENINNQKTILVIEDEMALQEAIRLKLKQDKSINVVVANSGEEAFVLVKEKKPDLVWLDLLMPKMSGFDFLKMVRKDKTLNDLKIVVVSASGGPDKVAQAKELGVLDYIVKGDGTLDLIIKRVKNFLT